MVLSFPPTHPNLPGGFAPSPLGAVSPTRAGWLVRPLLRIDSVRPIYSLRARPATRKRALRAAPQGVRVLRSLRRPGEQRRAPLQSPPALAPPARPDSGTARRKP